ncbi:unnamed protein product [Ambrosiozyma monospora]|uniref:Unnamed protein product n=1 Tax=Ambrosiozyma monospora TaxID=43982 RepID=A0ACB5T5X8_AMBMO|nr:unnamed protein product [Ambrosiozyma monospora]
MQGQLAILIPTVKRQKLSRIPKTTATSNPDDDDDEMEDAPPLVTSLSDTKELFKERLLGTLEFALTHSNNSNLPFAMSNLQFMTESFLSDKQFLVKIFDQIADIFERNILHAVSTSITNSLVPLKQFIDELQSWKLILDRIHQIFLYLDISTTLRSYYPHTDKIRRIKPFGIQLFASNLVYSRRSKDSEVSLFDREEIITRSKIMISLYDKLVSYLTQFNDSAVSKTEVEQCLSVFHEINEIELSISGKDKLKIVQLLKHMLLRICKDVQEKWVQENKLTYISKCLLLKQKYQSICESFDLFDKEQFHELLDQEYMNVLFNDSAIIPVLIELLKSPEEYKDQLKDAYATCCLIKDWDKSRFSNQFQKSTQESLAQLLNSKLPNISRTEFSSLYDALLTFKILRDYLIRDCFNNDAVFVASTQTLYGNVITKLNASTVICDTVLKSLDSFIKKISGTSRSRANIDEKLVSEMVEIFEVGKNDH